MHGFYLQWIILFCRIATLLKKNFDYFHHHCSNVTFNIGVNGTKVAETARHSFPCSSNVYFFPRLAAERCMASGCLQAVITPLLLLTQPKFSGQGEAQTLNAVVFCIKTGNRCCCRSDCLSIFYAHVNSNYVTSLHSHIDWI